MIALAVAAFVAIAFLKLPFPLIIIGAALAGSSLHFANRGGQAIDAGREAGTLAAAPEWTQPSARRFVDDGRRLVGDLAAAARRAAPCARRRSCIFGRGAVLLEDGGRHLRRRLCRALLRRAAGGRDPSLAAARRDAGRARPCRDDARPADPGAGLRRLPRRRAACGAGSADRRHRRRAGDAVVHFRAVLPVDFRGCALCRDGAKRALAGDRAGGGHRGGGRHHRQPCLVVRPACPVRHGRRDDRRSAVGSGSGFRNLRSRSRSHRRRRRRGADPLQGEPVRRARRRDGGGRLVTLARTA